MLVTYFPRISYSRSLPLYIVSLGVYITFIYYNLHYNISLLYLIIYFTSDLCVYIQL
eukprot:UN07939